MLILKLDLVGFICRGPGAKRTIDAHHHIQQSPTPARKLRFIEIKLRLRTCTEGSQSICR